MMMMAGKWFAIDWRVTGSWAVVAESAEEAQEKFDAAWGKPEGIMPERDGDAENDPPYPLARKGGRDAS